MDNIVVANVGRNLFMNTIYFCILNENIRSFITLFAFLPIPDFLVTNLLR